VASDTSVEELERAVVYFFEAGRKVVKYPVETVTIVWDMADFQCKFVCVVEGHFVVFPFTL
jgi:hypothetical protein